MGFDRGRSHVERVVASKLFSDSPVSPSSSFFTSLSFLMSKKPDLSGYNYGAIASLVLTADRTDLPRRDKEPDGAPTTLSGRINPREMGSRIRREAPKDVESKKKKATDKRDTSERQSKRKAEVANYGHGDIVDATQDIEGLHSYRPRTAETREVYELILFAVHQALGDQTHETVRSATDIVLETLKGEMKDFDKKKEIQEVIGIISNEQFSQLINLSKKVTDYQAEDEAEVDPDVERKEAEIDEEQGVAVLFDEEEDEEDEEEGYEVSDESDEEEGAPDATVEALDGVDDELVIGGDSTGRDKKAKTDKDIVSPHDIDGFWVQRQISEVYPDPVTAADKAASVLSILGSESGLRDCENQLMELFDYESFDVIKKFLKNRDVVVWCTKLMRSDSDERLNVEVAMREKGVGWILKDLAGDRKAKETGDDAMDVDQAPSVPKTATLAPGSTLQPKRTVDLEAMAFSQGGHLMSNKKCKLPEGSFKRERKGYEEIHVPAPKKKEIAENEIVPISAMPLWAREAFSVPTLNRIQSKLYPIAFGTDEPILLCAPTGAGKVCGPFGIAQSSKSDIAFLLPFRPMSLCLRFSASWQSTATRPLALSISTHLRLFTSPP